MGKKQGKSSQRRRGVLICGALGIVALLVAVPLLFLRKANSAKDPNVVGKDANEDSQDLVNSTDTTEDSGSTDLFPVQTDQLQGDLRRGYDSPEDARQDLTHGVYRWLNAVWSSENPTYSWLDDTIDCQFFYQEYSRDDGENDEDSLMRTNKRMVCNKVTVWYPMDNMVRNCASVYVFPHIYISLLG